MNTKSLKNAKDFLHKLGLSYDNLSSNTQQYLLDMTPSPEVNIDTISGSIISTKFNKKINNNMSGGKIVLPSEYFGITSDSYHNDVAFTETSTSSNMTRVGLQQTGGGREGLLKYSDYSKLKKQYENKFMRKLKLSKNEQKALVDTINEDITNAIKDSINNHKKGKLTKTMLNKNLKKQI